MVTKSYKQCHREETRAEVPWLLKIPGTRTVVQEQINTFLEMKISLSGCWRLAI